MFNPSKADQLLYLNEILWSVLEIQNRHTERAVKQIYENVGQVLSYVRLKIGMLTLDVKGEDIHAKELGLLVEKSIQDLRLIASSIDLDISVVGNKQLFDAVVQESLLWNAGLHSNCIQVTGNPKKLEPGDQLIVLALLQQVSLSIYNNGNGQLIAMKLKYHEKALQIIVDCAGKSPEFDQRVDRVARLLDTDRLPLTDRIKMINGKIKVVPTNANTFSVELIVPI